MKLKGRRRRDGREDFLSLFIGQLDIEYLLVIVAGFGCDVDIAEQLGINRLGNPEQCYGRVHAAGHRLRQMAGFHSRGFTPYPMFTSDAHNVFAFFRAKSPARYCI